VDDFRWQTFQTKQQRVDELTQLLSETTLKPETINPYLESVEEAPIEMSKNAADLLVRPFVSLRGLLKNVPRGTQGEDDEVLDAVETQIKYAGYIEREKKLAEKIQRLEALEIPQDFDFQKITALSMECRIKLERYRPRTIAQASRISGVSPADISVLLVYFGR
jgi:tRNA uridine 5-carboxymethylaminomethyl modification enzyme